MMTAVWICWFAYMKKHRINKDNLTGTGAIRIVLYEAYVVLVHRWWFFGSHHQHTASRAENERGLTFNQNANNKRRSGPDGRVGRRWLFEWAFLATWKYAQPQHAYRRIKKKERWASIGIRGTCGYEDYTGNRKSREDMSTAFGVV